jgi:hypothetical protein
MNTLALVLLAAAGLSPDTPLASDRVDLIEINHCYNEDGQLVFRQLLFWEWNELDSDYHVAAFRVLRAQTSAVRIDRQRNEYVASWCDSGVLRQVRAPHSRETWTQYDPELEDRRIFPQEYRRGLAHETATTATQRSNVR